MLPRLRPLKKQKAADVDDPLAFVSDLEVSGEEKQCILKSCFTVHAMSLNGSKSPAVTVRRLAPQHPMTKFSSMRLRLRSDINEHPANAVGLYKCTQAEIKAGTDAKKVVKHARTRAQHEELAHKQQLEGDGISQLATLEDNRAREDLEEAVCDDCSLQSAEEDEEEDEEADDLPSPVEDESEHDVESDIPASEKC
ncbi:hypothetical protein EWM64_g6748, partial [Hericium alpestre]